LSQFAALFQDVEYLYDNLLERLHFLTLHNRRHHFDDLFLINVFNGTKRCVSALETVGLWACTRDIRNFTLFTSLATAFQPDLFQYQIQFLNLKTF
jgi:hypothetical protein